jgi:phosphatidate cytidylyltransferase
MPDGASSRFRDLRRRAISALVLAPIALAGVWIGGLAFTLLIGAGAIVVIVEWVRLCRHAGAGRLPPGEAENYHYSYAPPHPAYPDAHRRLLAGALLAGGTLWMLLAAAALLWLRADPAAGRANLLFLTLLIWASDIGAYLVGRLAGGPLLAPRISPGKTWSGAAGGIAAALAVGWGAASLLPV